jgi:Flp pilus assembly protein TadG
MGMGRTITRKRGRAGSAAIEMAFAMPVLVLLLLGTADFGRVFYEAIAVESAARCGAQFAVVSSANQDNIAGMQQAALNDLQNLTGATATATKICRCGWGAPNDCSSNCASKRVYVQVTVQKTFNTIVSYPGIPSSTVLRATSVMRIK